MVTLRSQAWSRPLPGARACVLDDTLLLVSEWVTNALLHGGPPILLAIECDDTASRVRVRDGSSTLPAGREAAHGFEGGWGMTLLQLLATTWGVVSVADEYGDGKQVWLELRR